MIVNELATKISFIGNLKPLDRLNKGLDTSIKSIGVATIAFTTAGIALNAFVENTLRTADAQGQLANETGLSIEAIQEWGYAASVNGSSAEAFQRSIENLSKKIGEASTRGSEDFNRLGISVRNSFGEVKDAEQIMLELKDRFAELNLSKQQQADFLEKLGIDRSMIQTLNLSSEALQKLRDDARSLGVLTQKETDQLLAYNDSLTTVRYGVDALQKKIAVALTPQLKEVSEGFIDLLTNNKELIKDGLSKFFEVVSAGFKIIYGFGKAIVTLFSDMTNGQKIVVGLVGAIYILNKAFAMSPIGRLVTGVIALMTAVDDLSVGLNGGKSIIADWFKSWTGVDILPLVTEAIDGLGKAFNWLGDTISNVWEYISPILKALGSTAGKLLGMLFSGNGNISSNINLNKQLSPNAMLPSAVTNSNSNTNTTNNSFNIEIKTNDPQTAGVAVESSLKQMVRNGNTQFAVGGR